MKQKSSKGKDEAKPGRPSLPEGEARTKTLQVRYKPDEYARLEKVAQAKGMKLAEWARKALNAAAKK
jgi:predicted HicB family RNase H-like nuclease